MEWGGGVGGGNSNAGWHSQEATTGRAAVCLLAQSCTLCASLYEHDVGEGMEKMGHTHDSWQGNIALGLRAIARGGRFGGVNNCAYRGSHQGYMGLQFASGADFAKSIEVWGVGL